MFFDVHDSTFQPREMFCTLLDRGEFNLVGLALEQVRGSNSTFRLVVYASVKTNHGREEIDVSSPFWETQRQIAYVV